MTTTSVTGQDAAQRRAQLRRIADTYFEALAAKRIETVAYAEHVTLRSPLAPPDGQIPYELYPVTGREAVQSWFRGLYPLLGETKVLEYYFDEALSMIAARSDVTILDPPCVLRVVDRFSVNDAGEIVEQENHYDPRPVTHPAPVREAVAGALTEQERELLRDLLESGRDACLESIGALSGDQWTFKPDQDGWSIAECAEHIVVSDEALLANVRGPILAGPRVDSHAELQGKDGMVVGAMRDRTTRSKTFDFLEPTGRWSDRVALTEAFRQARAETAAYVRDTDDALHDHAAPLPGLDLLDGYQWLLLLAAHTQRHVAQIEDIKKHRGYPA